jgi:SAM-dependent methyltransferase
LSRSTSLHLHPLFVLDEPQYHHQMLGRPTRVRGAALAIDGDRIETVAVYRGDESIGEGRVNLACPELAAFPQPNASTSRFQFDVTFEPEMDYDIRGRTTGGRELPLFMLNTASARLDAWARLGRRIAAYPAPPPALVFTTQGGAEARAYTDSAVSGFFSIAALLERAGCDPGAARAVLDIGCGTGRLLLGWHADGPSRALEGVDVSRKLIEWSHLQLGDVARWRVCALAPPLPFDDGSFDVIQMVSVLTHLPLNLQCAWLAESRRLLKPGGAVLVTLHGDLYARLLLDDAHQRRFADTGYVEMAGAAPGENGFSTFHSRAWAERLFGDFSIVHLFPRGDDDGTPRLFPIAALQDVYVARA